MKPATHYAEPRREMRACKRCGHERRVKVVDVMAEGEKIREMVEDHCAACKADFRAAHYAREAERFRKKADEIRRKRIGRK